MLLIPVTKAMILLEHSPDSFASDPILKNIGRAFFICPSMVFFMDFWNTFHCWWIISCSDILDASVVVFGAMSTVGLVVVARCLGVHPRLKVLLEDAVVLLSRLKADGSTWGLSSEPEFVLMLDASSCDVGCRARQKMQKNAMRRRIVECFLVSKDSSR